MRSNEEKAAHAEYMRQWRRDHPEYKETNKRWRRANSERVRAANRAYQRRRYGDDPTPFHEKHRRWVNANIERHRANQRARDAVRRALRNGTLTRPEVCDECGEKPPPVRDGRSPIEAHHDDHSKRLEVRWLCKRCHAIADHADNPR